MTYAEYTDLPAGAPPAQLPPARLPAAVTIAVDTEYYQAHTLTVQAAVRLGPEAIAVQVYRSRAVPDLPLSFAPADYFPPGPGGYGPFFHDVVVRPVRPLTPDLSPLRMLRDLYGLAGLNVLSRHDGLARIDLFGVPGPAVPLPVPINVKSDPRTGRWRVPDVRLTLVGHFLTADFARIHGRDFLEGLLKCKYWRDRAPLVIRHRKLTQLVEQWPGRTRLDPALEFCELGGEFFQARVGTRDTVLPYGWASLDGLCRTFLGLGKSAAVAAEDKRDMRRAFAERPADAYGYAMADAVNTLLVYEQMQARDREIYRSFGFAEREAPPLRTTVGGRVSTFLLRTTRRDAARGSRQLRSGAALRALMAGGGVGLFARHPGASRYGRQTGQVHGGLLFSRSPTKLWHESAGMLRDVDMGGCYNRVAARLNVHWGRPVIFEPGESRLSLAEAVALARRHADDDGWLVRVSGPISARPNALVPSAEDAVTSLNYRQKLGKGKRCQARQRAFHLEALRDPSSVQGTRGSRLYSAAVESGVVTWATWLMVQALPPRLRAEYEALTADSIVFYPRALAARSGEEFDRLLERYRNDGLPWQGSLDLEGMELVRREKIDAEYVTLVYPLGDYARRVGAFREAARRESGKGSGPDAAWKVHANSMFGVLASPHLPTNNFVAANLVTAQARAEAFALSQALNAVQTITDGCTYRLDQVPACTYEECLKIKPDYPIRRAEAGDGIPFLDPSAVPQDDAGFTAWYREHVKRFFGVGGPEYDHLLGTHALEHKRTGVSKAVAFDALACDGSGNYLKCSRAADGGWAVEDFAARSYGKESKQALQGWVVRTYSADRLVELPPLTQDRELLSFLRACQRARRALDGGVPEVVLPLGLEGHKVMNYRAIKASAFVFQTPEQRAALVKQVQRFEDRTSAGVEALALRRAYKGRREGSLTDLAETVYRRIRQGEMNLTRALNLNKKYAKLEAMAAERRRLLRAKRSAAEEALTAQIDARNLDLGDLPTACLLRPEDCRVMIPQMPAASGPAAAGRVPQAREGAAAPAPCA
jgi:hypothetical protein